MLIKINNCAECPAYAFYDRHLCKVGANEDRISFLHDYPTLPKWCPLRKLEIKPEYEEGSVGILNIHPDSFKFLGLVDEEE